MVDMHITSDGLKLITIGAMVTKASIVDIKKKVEVGQILEKEYIICSSLSKDNRFLLLNINSKLPELHLWSLDTLELINRFTGFAQQNYVIRCCFGWKDEQLLACGSEDGNIYIWHRNHDKPLIILKDDSDFASSINCIAWHPTDPSVIASAHDNYKIKIWSKSSIEKVIVKPPKKK